MAITSLLITSLLLTCAFKFLNYLWERRYLYIHSITNPGPLSIPFLGSFFSFTNPQSIFTKFKKVAQYYNGKTFRVWILSDLFFVISDPTYIEQIANSADYLHKGHMYDILIPLMGEGLLSSSGEKWRRHKKLLMPIFNRRNLESYVQNFALNANKLVIGLERYVNNDKMVPVQLFYSNTLNTACDTLVGVDIEHFSRQEKNTFGKSIKCGLMIQVMRRFSAIFRWIWIFNFQGHKMLEEYSKNVFDFVDKLLVKKRMDVDYNIEENTFEEESPCTSVLDFLPKVINGANKVAMKELKDEVATFLIAASDTTTITECFLLIALGCFPDIQKRVYDEVLNVVGPVRDLEYSDLPKLKYMEMVLKETLRYFSPVAFIFREVRKDMFLGPTFMPKGSNIGIPIWAVHHNPKFWPNPSKFDPERFSLKNSRNPYTFIPFSAGLRVCPGEKFAMMKIKTVIATIVRRYEIFTDYKNLEEIEFSYDFTTSAKYGYKLRVSERKFE